MFYVFSDPNKKVFRKKLRNNATVPEKLLWGKLRQKRLGEKFIRQHSIGKYIVDFYCAKKKLVIELDGGQHNDDKNISYDFVRTDYLKSVGMTVIRFWNTDVLNNIDVVCDEIKKKLEK